MEVLFIVLAVIAAGAAVVFFMNSPMGMHLRKRAPQPYSTVFQPYKAQRLRHLSTRFTILLRKKETKRKWLADFNYLYLLRDAGCFDPRTAPQPEQFAELMANVEEKIRLHESDAAK